jgi:type 1 glutamine amidotransferase
MKRPSRIFIGFAALLGLAAGSASGADAKLRVLILSGANNHNWKTTTPAIKATLEESGRFEVDVEERVMDMKPESFTPYAAIVSNFNTFGKDAPAKKEWDAATKKGFLDHIAKGHGLVIVHAGSSVFYDWPEFHQLACGTWKDGTSHGAIHVNRVTFNDPDSPITRGLEPFWIRDEFWQKTLVAPGAKALGSVTPDPAFKGSGKPENILFSTEAGGGRGFAIMLGHDALGMSNPAWRTLLQRGTEWAASGKVSIPPAKNWPATKESVEPPALSWQQSKTHVALCKGEQVLWQLVVDPAEPKVYFHPLSTVGGEVLTVNRPADHPWHHGLWWSWKFINGVNYWEENPKTQTSDGKTELVSADFKPGNDFSMKVALLIHYRLPGQAVLMTEERLLSITPPDAAGCYRIDWQSTFTAGAAALTLGRTPLAHEAGGKAYGGYAGLSARLLFKPEGWSIRSSEGKNDMKAAHGQKARWMDFSSAGAGLAICEHQDNLRSPSPWYVHDQKPMSFFSPSPLYHESLDLAAGKSLQLKYRVLVHAQSMTAAQFDAECVELARSAKP